MAFQQAGLFDWRTVEKNIELPLELKGWDKAKRRARAQEMLELVKLPEFARHMPWQLSGGMQQRIAIARALAAHPELLLMDEPFGALDEMTREHMQAELLRICDATETTVVFVTHSIPEAVYLSDRVVVMSPRPGRITDVIDVDLGRGRNEDTRELTAYYADDHQVREALRKVERRAPVAGSEGSTTDERHVCGVRASERRVRRGIARSPPVVFGIGFLLVWEFAVQVFDLKPYFLPAPSAISEAFFDNFS